MRNVLTFTIRGSLYVIQQKDIIYMENELRKIHLYTTDDDHLFYGTFKQVMEDLDDSFMKCSRSYILNKDHIRAFCQNDNYKILMDNGQKIPLSKKTFTHAKNEFREYIKKSRSEEYRPSEAKKR